MSFEKMINATNDYYLSHGLAVIHKKPTPIQIVRVDYPQRSRAKIVEAYLDRPQRLTIQEFMMDTTSTLKQRKPGKNMRFRWRIFISIRSSIWNKFLPSKESALSSFTFLLSKKPTYCRPLIWFVSIIKIWDKKFNATWIYRENGYRIEPGAFPQIP